MPDFEARMADLRERVQTALDGFVAEHRPSLLEVSPELEPALDALVDMVGGGKRFRAACCYWGFLGAGGEDGPAIARAASSLELLQASALIHDDVMDNSDTRRGQPAVHRRFERLHHANAWHGDAGRFGAATAILIGDLALVWSDAMLFTADFDVAAMARARTIFDSMRMELMAGQYLDVLEQSLGGGSVERARRVMRYKTTAYTIERPLHLGAALAGADGQVMDAYSAFGVPLGEAFQLRDDLLGIFGDTELTGKPAGDDLREGKRTILIALAQEQATPSQRKVLDASIGRPDLEEAAVARVREVLHDTGAVAAVEQHIDVNLGMALAALDAAPITDDAASALRMLAGAATHRSA